MNSEEKTISVIQVETQIRTFMKGKILTVLDASYTDPQQREAVKQLVKEKIDDQVEWLCYGGRASYSGNNKGLMQGDNDDSN